MTAPEILAPAGDKNAFMAAIAAGADAVYCGLKLFSARMEAANFSMEELAGLSRLARQKKVAVHVALNTQIKESETGKIFKILCKLSRYVLPDCLIVQDPALVPLARAAGHKKGIHLSTLGNCTAPLAAVQAAKMGFDKIVLPREFTLDDIKTVAAHTPETIGLEIFVHGALCYSVSGRCYWSSWFGGKSALRGRCVQPCRRLYDTKGKTDKLFSCTDFSADVLAKVLKEIPRVTTWKIEGRKKSPHYVYYAVKAYKLLRDHPEEKKTALSFLDYAMGRPFSHYNLLTHRKINPLVHDSQTGSGLFVGRTKNPPQPYFVTREALLPDDLIRIGNEEKGYHAIQRVTRAVPKNAKFIITKTGKKRLLKGTPVMLIDRRDTLLQSALGKLDRQLAAIETIPVRPVDRAFPQSLCVKPPKNRTRQSGKVRPLGHMVVVRNKRLLSRGKRSTLTGIWLSGQQYSVPVSRNDWVWLDPVLFPEDEALCQKAVSRLLAKGARNFVLNTPWQISLFDATDRLNLWAGPFCNIANSATLAVLAETGFSGAIISPELPGESLLSLPANSPLPLGAVIRGNWPLGISRVLSPALKPGQPFTSPQGETAWVSKFNANYHLFPNWPLDLSAHEDRLVKAGFSLFVHIREHVPRAVSLKKRPGTWNWNLKLL